MKNIHVLPTSQLSRLHFDEALFISPNFQISKTINSDVEGRNIYITNDEKPKEGDWCLDKFNQRWKLEDKKLMAFDIKGIKSFSTDNILGHECKKIILTTDQDLIKDGVQAIDDEFLEWFVKNPSCESVEVINDTLTVGEMSKLPLGARNHKYKTIIPKEEPNYNMKQEILDEMKRLEEPKQETLEEAGLQHCDMLDKFPELVNPLFTFKQGAKWQQEQDKKRYSEEEVLELFQKYISTQIPLARLRKILCKEFNQWFEQFKKK